MLGHLMYLTPAQGKPRGKILSEDMWDKVRWKVGGEGSGGEGCRLKKGIPRRKGTSKDWGEGVYEMPLGQQLCVAMNDLIWGVVDV